MTIRQKIIIFLSLIFISGILIGFIVGELRERQKIIDKINEISLTDNLVKNDKKLYLIYQIEPICFLAIGEKDLNNISVIDIQECII